MNTVLNVLAAAILGQVFLFLCVLCHVYWKKSKVENVLNIQCSSGDSEVMSFTLNFNEGDSQDLKNSKISEIFEQIQDRRDENHEKFVAIQKKAQEDNERELAEKGPDALRIANRVGPVEQRNVN